jgi:hypothetical protein
MLQYHSSLLGTIHSPPTIKMTMTMTIATTLTQLTATSTTTSTNAVVDEDGWL